MGLWLSFWEADAARKERDRVIGAEDLSSMDIELGSLLSLKVALVRLHGRISPHGLLEGYIMMRGDVSARSDRIYICSSRYTIHLLKIQLHGNVSAAGLDDYCWTQEINRPGVWIQTSSSSLQRPGRHGAGFRCCRTSCVPIKFPRGLVRFETSTNPDPRQQICVSTPRHPVDSGIEADHGLWNILFIQSCTLKLFSNKNLTFSIMIILCLDVRNRMPVSLRGGGGELGK
jgi:hypothetical protein